MQAASVSSPSPDVAKLDKLRRCIDALLSEVLHNTIGEHSYQRMAEVLHRSLDCDTVCVFFYDHRVRKFENVGFAGYSPEFSDNLAQRKGVVRSDIIGRAVVLTNGPRILHSFDEVERLADPPDSSGTKSMLLIPVRIDKGIIAGFSMGMASDHTWDQDDFPLYSLLASYCALVLRMVQLIISTQCAVDDAVTAAKRDLRLRLEAVMDEFAPTPEAAQASAPSVSTIDDVLSKREKDVLFLLSTGATNSEISNALGISVSTVKKHIHSLFGKLSLSNRTQAAAEWRRVNQTP